MQILVRPVIRRLESAGWLHTFRVYYHARRFYRACEQCATLTEISRSFINYCSLDTLARRVGFQRRLFPDLQRRPDSVVDSKHCSLSLSLR